MVGGLTTRPALVVVTGGIFLTELVEGSCLGGDGGNGGGGDLIDLQCIGFSIRGFQLWHRQRRFRDEWKF